MNGTSMCVVLHHKPMDPQASSAVTSAVQPVTSAVFDLKCLVGDACRAGQPASNVLSCTALVPQSAMRFQLQNTFLCVRFRDCKSMHLHPQFFLLQGQSRTSASLDKREIPFFSWYMPACTSYCKRNRYPKACVGSDPIPPYPDPNPGTQT